MEFYRNHQSNRQHLKNTTGTRLYRLKDCRTKIPNGKYYQQDPMWFYYSCLSAGPKTFAVGYIGTKVEKDEDFEKKINRILEFDYSGKPLRSYNFSHDIEAFDIDYANRILYTIEERDEPVIMKYNLPD